jgi:DNA-binding NarL/FixJ family response regulator
MPYCTHRPTERSGGTVCEGRTTNEPIKVLLADDHTMFREGLAGVLASYGGMEVVAEVPNDEDALRHARDLSPDVVIMQVQMPFERALQTLEAMRAFARPPKVVIVTMFENPRYVRGLTGVGASAYLLKSGTSEHLIGVVRAAVLDPEGRNVVVGMPTAMLEEAQAGSEGVLSARELEILLLSARGLSNTQIAASIHLAEGTVKRHLANVYNKMGVRSRGQAAKEALLREWITIEEITAEEDAEGAGAG